MPTVLRTGPYRFHFYAGDGPEPPHIHVVRDRNEAKFWLGPVTLEWNRGYPQHELRYIQNLVDEHEATLREGWNDFFSGG